MTKDEIIRKLHEAKLYAILDTGYSKPEDWPRLALEFITGGVGVLQIRAKHAADDDLLAWTREILTVSAPAGVPLIINDHPAVAVSANADGCHVGQDDMPVAEVRKITGNEMIVGKSTHSLVQAIAAQKEGADYIGFGPIFATPTKPDYQPVGTADIQQMTRQVHIPHFCIGGVKLENCAALHSQGVRRVVIVSGLLQSRAPSAYAQEVCRILAGSPR
ncbi:MAG: thiamine phosphate synthase [Verrucomicrobiales bacterium]|nr:thiamine phosphate synthase [Verrucomicrobiales bacterium]